MKPSAWSGAGAVAGAGVGSGFGTLGKSRGRLDNIFHPACEVANIARTDNCIDKGQDEMLKDGSQ